MTLLVSILKPEVEGQAGDRTIEQQSVCVACAHAGGEGVSPCHAEVDSAGLPLAADLDQNARDQSEQGCFVREERCYPCATLQLPIEPLHDVRSLFRRPDANPDESTRLAMLPSIHSANPDAVSACAVTACFKSRSASNRRGALKMDRIGLATGFIMPLRDAQVAALRRR